MTINLVEEIYNVLKIITSLHYKTCTDLSFHKQNSAELQQNKEGTVCWQSSAVFAKVKFLLHSYDIQEAQESYY